MADLAANNNRDWFEANKAIYQAQLLKPAQALVATLGQKLQTISNDIRYDTRTNGSGVLMRIYRDTRFSKDKPPTKPTSAAYSGKARAKKPNTPLLVFNWKPPPCG